MDDEAQPAPKRHKGQFQKGQSGNPSGRPKVVTEIRDLAREGTATAIAALKRIAGDKKAPAAAQVAAATALLDRGWGRPYQAIAMGISVHHRLDDLSDDELLSIINSDDDTKLIEH